MHNYTPADHHAAVFAGHGSDNRSIETTQYAIRVWGSSVPYIAALVHNTGMSRTEVINRLLDAGIGAVFAAMSDADRNRLLKTPAAVMDKALSDTSSEDQP